MRQFELLQNELFACLRASSPCAPLHCWQYLHFTFLMDLAIILFVTSIKSTKILPVHILSSMCENASVCVCITRTHKRRPRMKIVNYAHLLLHRSHDINCNDSMGSPSLSYSVISLFHNTTTTTTCKLHKILYICLLGVYVW